MIRISEYIANKQKRETTTFVVTGGRQFYIENGKQIPAKDFEAMYPLPDKVFMSAENKWHGENPDKTKI